MLLARLAICTLLIGKGDTEVSDTVRSVSKFIRHLPSLVLDMLVT